MTTTPEEPQSTPEEAVLQAAAAVLDTAEERLEVSLDPLDASRRLLLVHAHPDDEAINNGATMAMYAAEGVHVTLVTCTLGEEGEVLVPELEHLAADRDDQLGTHRVGELATAMEALGVRDVRFLGGPGRYRDSGMMGLPTNERPECFWQADVDEAAGLLVDMLRELRPQVVVTYNENGDYGHPDHIQANRVTLRAVDLAADASFGTGEPWQVSKLYYVASPDSVVRDGFRRLRDLGDTTFAEIDPDGEIPWTVPDEQVTTAVDGTAYVDAKLAAMKAHATQITIDGPFFALSNNLGNAVWATEHYTLARGEPGPGDGPNGWETDLFAGLEAGGTSPTG